MNQTSKIQEQKQLLNYIKNFLNEIEFYEENFASFKKRKDKFSLKIGYELNENTLNVIWKVQNLDNKKYDLSSFKKEIIDADCFYAGEKLSILKRLELLEKALKGDE